MVARMLAALRACARRPRWRYSLGGMLLFVALLCAAGGWLAHRRRQEELQRELARVCEIHDHYLVYDWQEEDKIATFPVERVPYLLRGRVGQEHFQRVAAISNRANGVCASVIPVVGQSGQDADFTPVAFRAEDDASPTGSDELNDQARRFRSIKQEYSKKLEARKTTEPPWRLAAELGGIRRISSSAVTDDDLAHFARMTDLRELDLSEAEITGEGLRHLEGLSGLEILNVQDTLIGDAALFSIGRIENLRELRLGVGDWEYVSFLTERRLRYLNQLARLRKLAFGLNVRYEDGEPLVKPENERLWHRQLSLPELESVEIEFFDPNRWQGSAEPDKESFWPEIPVTFLRQFPKLRECRLHGCRLVQHDESQAGPPESLEVLEVGSWTQFGNVGVPALSLETLEAFCGSPRLEVVAIAAPIDDDFVPALLSLPALQELNLVDCQFSEEGARNLFEAKPHLTGDIRDRFGELLEE